MHNTQHTLTAPKMDMDTLQRNLHYQQLELGTYEYEECSIINPTSEIDPEIFFSSLVNECNYFTQEQYESNTNTKERLSIIHFNSWSLYANFDAIRDFLECFTHPFSIIAISETLCNNARGMDFTLNGYHFRYVNGNDKIGGGVALFVHHSINVDVVESMTLAVDGIMECLTVEIQNRKNKNIIVSCVCRTQGANIDTFNEWMD